MSNIPCPPHTYFLTLRLADARADHLVLGIDALRRALRSTLAALPMRVVAASVLPSVTHMIWALPAGAAELAPRVALFKRRFAQGLAQNAEAPDTGRPLWHRDHWACHLETAAALARHQRLIHTAAVDAGLCARPEEWPYCSLHRDRGFQARAAARPAAGGPLALARHGSVPVPPRPSAVSETAPLVRQP